MAESKFGRTFRDKLKVWGFEFFRVESHSTSPGMPDIHWLQAGTGATGWVELKQCSTGKPPAKVSYRPNQAPWLQDYQRKGGRACTIIHMSKTNRAIFIPGNESIAAGGELRRALGALTFDLGTEEGWRGLAKAILRP